MKKIIKIEWNGNNGGENVEIERLGTIHELKQIIYEITNIEIEKQILYHRGKVLKNEEMIYDVIDDEIPVRMIERMNGGKDITVGGFKIDVINLALWLSYFFILLPLIVMIFTTGIIPVMAMFLRQGLVWIFNKVGTVSGMSNYTIYNIFVWLIAFVLWLMSIIIVVMILFGGVLFPFANWISGSVCDGMWWSSYGSFVIAIIFFILYGLLNIPDEVNIFLRAIGEKALILNPIINPITGLMDKIVDSVKYEPFYVGFSSVGLILQGYHAGIDLMVNGFIQLDAFLRRYDCDTEEGRKKLRILLKNWRDYPFVSPKIRELHLEEYMDTIALRFDDKAYEKMKCDYDNLPVWMRYNPFSKQAGKFQVSTYFSEGFCTAMNAVKALSDSTNEVGGMIMVARMIKSGSVIGWIIAVLLLLMYIILIIYYFVWEKVASIF